MPKRAVFERSRRELSLDVSFGVCTCSWLWSNRAWKVSPWGVPRLRYIRTTVLLVVDRGVTVRAVNLHRNNKTVGEGEPGRDGKGRSLCSDHLWQDGNVEADGIKNGIIYE